MGGGGALKEGTSYKGSLVEQMIMCFSITDIYLMLYEHSEKWGFTVTGFTKKNGPS